MSIATGVLIIMMREHFHFVIFTVSSTRMSTYYLHSSTGSVARNKVVASYAQAQRGSPADQLRVHAVS